MATFEHWEAEIDPTNKEWRNLGPIKAKQDLQSVPSEPGLYKLTFRIWGMAYAYIGQTANLQRRICEYVVSPTQGNKMEHFLHDLIKAGEAELSIRCVGLEPEKVRCRHEDAAIAEARQQGLKCLNRGESDDARMLRFRLESEEKMLNKDLARVRTKLLDLPN